ncbi:hypothetical protein U6N87_12725, partial [Cutibacterium acnes]
MPRRHGSGRKLAGQRTHITHPVQQVTVAARVGAVHATANTARCTAASTPLSVTSHQYTLTVREVASQIVGDMLPIRGSSPRNRDRQQ